VFGLQKQELLNHEEQEEDYRPDGAKEVLPVLSSSHGTPRDEVSRSNRISE
jgi:hypothetical protein